MNAENWTRHVNPSALNQHSTKTGHKTFYYFVGDNEKPEGVYCGICQQKIETACT